MEVEANVTRKSENMREAHSRENRSKLFFSSGFRLTWQVRRLSLAGGALGWQGGGRT